MMRLVVDDDDDQCRNRDVMSVGCNALSTIVRRADAMLKYHRRRLSGSEMCIE